MHDSDVLLENIVRSWAIAKDVEISINPETQGGPRTVAVEPLKCGALPVNLWISDDGEHVACSIGKGSWWDQVAPLNSYAIQGLLSAISSGKAWEEVQRVGGYTVSRRGYIEMEERKLTYQYGFFIPWLNWVTESHEQY